MAPPASRSLSAATVSGLRMGGQQAYHSGNVDPYTVSSRVR